VRLVIWASLIVKYLVNNKSAGVKTLYSEISFTPGILLKVLQKLKPTPSKGVQEGWLN